MSSLYTQAPNSLQLHYLRLVLSSVLGGPHIFILRCSVNWIGNINALTTLMLCCFCWCCFSIFRLRIAVFWSQLIVPASSELACCFPSNAMRKPHQPISCSICSLCYGIRNRRHPCLLPLKHQSKYLIHTQQGLPRGHQQPYQPCPTKAPSPSRSWLQLSR